MACIAPWNFPLAIFTGQVSAALAAGNPVLAKPAEQTPLIAAAAVRLFHRAGVPVAALQLLPGRGETTGAALVRDPRIAGVLFTGSTGVAQTINRILAARTDDPVLIAETGGLNAMVVDSSALPEQVVTDALASAFDSAGQRCSALRILCLQEDIADTVVTMLRGAMRELRVGDPRRLDTDVGPVIDADAHAALTAHVARMRAAGAAVDALPLPAECAHGSFFAPTLIELADVRHLAHEVFGPVLHVVRFGAGELPQCIDALNAAGYGLTHGIQTRIDETVDAIAKRIRAGNVYVNRNIIGAVVGVQPFGGEGLSGTGPKAGGPAYLWRLVREPSPQTPDRGAFAPELLPGPTGETNTLTRQPRGRIACLGPGVADLAAQVEVATRLGNVALVATAPSHDLSAAARDASAIVDDPLEARPDAVLFAGDAAAGTLLRQRLAAREGALVPLVTPRDGRYDAAQLTCERTLTVNTTASGGNASLLSLEDAEPA
jgi:RHH-type proline utilization regulon transcriptional repressor/proline dehydrogenase/delta 1-pyrroline-5-carboxylate dehydrogenase